MRICCSKIIIKSAVLVFFSASTIFFSGCSALYQPGTQAINFASGYKKDATVIHPEYFIFHESDSVSQLNFSINPKELLYTRQLNENSFSALFRISWRLLESYETLKLIDSSSVIFTDTDNNQNNITGLFPFNAKYGHSYLLEVVLTDLKRGSSTKQFLNLDKLNHWSWQNFMIRDENKNPLFKTFFSKDEKILLHYKHQTKAIHVSYYKRNFPIAVPPFAMSENKPFDYKPDSTYVIFPDSESFVVQLPVEGLYHFQTDTSQKEGLTLFNYRKDFPKTTSTQDLFFPLRYITSNEEYTEIEYEKQKKTAIDNFWLTVAGSRERAKELIRKFYHRVEDTNVFFTSYIEGWQTDRGMIYLIYGPPNAIYRSTYSEKWVYGEESNMMSLSFLFVKVINPFTDNDYSLERSPLYKTSWYRAVDVWRQGRVY